MYHQEWVVEKQIIDNINNIVNTILSGGRLEGKDYTNGNLNREI